jgi:two-component system, NarL family, response regulator NreC
VIVDIQMPGLSGMDVIRQIRQRLAACRMIVLSMYDEEEFVLGAMRDGATGYVLKESSADDLVLAVRSVMRGDRYLSPRLADRAFRMYISQPAPVENQYSTLTNREREVLHLSAEGLTLAEIARRLTISPRTVEVHRANLMRKLGLHSQVDLVQYARQMKIIPDSSIP